MYKTKETKKSKEKPKYSLDNEKIEAVFLFASIGMFEFQHKGGKLRRKCPNKYTKFIIIHDKALTL